ncbi:MAG: hypothetical protein COT73_02885 [Bdellovibrio sp. CG10_big_fil_rev_8_21_14_0_10_47_8]|nr:MAG: hypothetical protein COT73_02885 [Bdellovibrio sp. CG10_big_fil_rev_8_21_14_0_10_47_8]
MGKYEFKVDKSASDFKVSISGTIDEDVDFSPYQLAGATSVEVHLGAVKSINSCGIREWIKWIGTAGSAKVEYFECPKIIVDQINMVQGFLPAQGRVKSFYVPYYSDDSGAEKNVLFTEGKEFTEQGLQTPPVVKDDEGKEMEMDVVEAKYFKFLKK